MFSSHVVCELSMLDGDIKRECETDVIAFGFETDVLKYYGIIVLSEHWKRIRFVIHEMLCPWLATFESQLTAIKLR